MPVSGLCLRKMPVADQRLDDPLRVQQVEMRGHVRQDV